MGKIIKHDFNDGNTVDFGNLTKEQILRKILTGLESAESLGTEVNIRLECFNCINNKYIPVIMTFEGGE